jgi:preprotein translocase subunit SecG
MELVVVVIHLIIAVALVAVVLLQRSEGGALGMGGGGGGMSGFVTGRSAASILTRATAALAACFIATSLILAIMAGSSDEPASIVDMPAPAQEEGAPSSPSAPVR